jgi:hypothetical protein
VNRWAKKKEPRAIGPAPLTAEERLDGAQWYYYKWLSLSELAGIPLAPRLEPGPGEI